MAKLNYIKIRDEVFHLQVGDIITSNMEGNYSYVPSTSENKKKLPFRNWHKSTSISITKKYHKAVENAENFELIEERPSHSKEMPHLRYKKWKVVSVEKEEVPVKKGIEEDVYFIQLDERGFKFDSAKIVKETAKQLKVEGSLGCRYLSTINKQYDFNKVLTEYGKFYVYCFLNDLDKFRDELYERKKKALESALKRAQIDLDEFTKNMEEQGY